jgi:hypothetical protein
LPLAISLPFISVFFGAGDWTSGLMHDKKKTHVLPLSYIPRFLNYLFLFFAPSSTVIF